MILAIMFALLFFVMIIAIVVDIAYTVWIFWNMRRR